MTVLLNICALYYVIFTRICMANSIFDLSSLDSGCIGCIFTDNSVSIVYCHLQHSVQSFQGYWLCEGKEWLTCQIYVEIEFFISAIDKVEVIFNHLSPHDIKLWVFGIGLSIYLIDIKCSVIFHTYRTVVLIHQSGWIDLNVVT